MNSHFFPPQQFVTTSKFCFESALDSVGIGMLGDVDEPSGRTLKPAVVEVTVGVGSTDPPPPPPGGAVEDPTGTILHVSYSASVGAITPTYRRV